MHGTRRMNYQVAVAFDWSSDKLGQLPDGDGHGKHPFFPREHGGWTARAKL
jgi:hypothetical protein